jgi:hypothetical protein
MKLRLRGNSIRFRLTRGEVERLSSEGLVEERVGVGTGENGLIYALQLADVGSPKAEFSEGRLAVLLPRTQAAKWAAGDLVGIEAADRDVRILVEKDFTCLQPRPGEDESDMYNNPAGAKNC